MNQLLFHIKSIKKHLFVILLLSFSTSGISQDIHFTQFFAHPPSLNPALTGNFNEKVRVGLNYKNQWASFTNPFNTKSVYVDSKLHPKILNKADWIGIGAMVFTDNAGTGNLQNFKGVINGALIKSLNRFKTMYLAVGFSVGLGQKSIDFNALSFGNQWNGVDFDAGTGNGETFTKNSFLYFDASTGILFSATVNKRIDVFVGGSIFHVSVPNETFYDSKNSKSMKLLAHTGAVIVLTKNRKLLAKPAIYFTHQLDINEMIIGSNFVFQLNANSLYLGGWFRTSGDFAPLVGLGFQAWTILVNYDFNISKLSYSTHSKGGIEISVTYKIRDYQQLGSGYLNDPSKKRAISCPSIF